MVLEAQDRDGVKNHPIYVAVAKGTPLNLEEKIVDAYPEGLKTPNIMGSLPLHIICTKTDSKITHKKLAKKKLGSVRLHQNMLLQSNRSKLILLELLRKYFVRFQGAVKVAHFLSIIRRQLKVTICTRQVLFLTYLQMMRRYLKAGKTQQKVPKVIMKQ